LLPDFDGQLGDGGQDEFVIRARLGGAVIVEHQEQVGAVLGY
jgi:hypothetical protein